MRMFDVQAIEIAAPRQKVFEFVGEARNLPRWAHACRRRIASGVSIQERSNSRGDHRPTKRFRDWFVASSRRDGQLRFIAPVTLAHRPLTSPVAWPSRSTPGVVPRAERRRRVTHARWPLEVARVADHASQGPARPTLARNHLAEDPQTCLAPPAGLERSSHRHPGRTTPEIGTGTTGSPHH